jgi:hypothetical protein
MWWVLCLHSLFICTAAICSSLTLWATLDSQMVSDILSQWKLHRQLSVSHLNSCCLLLVILNNVFKFSHMFYYILGWVQQMAYDKSHILLKLLGCSWISVCFLTEWSTQPVIPASTVVNLKMSQWCSPPPPTYLIRMVTYVVHVHYTSSHWHGSSAQYTLLQSHRI